MKNEKIIFVIGNHRMDTLRDKTRLEKLWESGKAPWKVWED